MAETAKVLERIVVVPDRDAGCSLVNSCRAGQVRAWKAKSGSRHHQLYQHLRGSEQRRHPVHSRNAVAVVNSIPADQPILFLPDISLGNYESADRREHEDLAGRLHRASYIRRGASLPPSWKHPRQWLRLIRNAPPTC